MLTLVNIVAVIASPYLLYIALKKSDIVRRVIINARKISIKDTVNYKNEEMLLRVWSLPVGKLYFDAVEYQKTEGWCCSTTIRSVLKSIPSIKAQHIPESKGGPATVNEFASKMDSGERLNILRSTVFLGSEGYENFLACMKDKVNNTKYRVAVNFLRSSLFGFKKPFWFPMNFILGFLGGHFSPIVGYLEVENLVAVFDVNHEYSVYLVDARRLYDSIATFDIMSGLSRGYVVTEILE